MTNRNSGMKRVGLLGAGYIADWHAFALRKTGNVKVVAVCDTVRTRGCRLAEKAKHQFESLDAMLDAKVCDSIHVLLPPHLHAPFGKRVLERGVDAYIEKPLCLAEGDCQQLIDTAARSNARLAVCHNFLFLPSYEKLKYDVTNGRLGKLDHVTVNWQFPLNQLQGGPFDSWLFSEPTNVLYEIAPHAFAFVLDLVGPLRVLHVRASNQTALPDEKTFFRRWQILGETNQGTAVAVNLSFTNGFPNRSVEVRGSTAQARCDYERDIYYRDAFNDAGVIFEPLKAVRLLNKQLRAEARTNFIRQVKSANKLAPFGLSITRALQNFYGNHSLDSRLSGDLGRDVIKTIREVADLWKATHTVPSSLPASQLKTNDVVAVPSPSVLVLGGTGFIGTHLVDALVRNGYSVRVLTRSTAPGINLHNGWVQIMSGQLGDELDLTRALNGIKVVFHLARAYADNWEEYRINDVEVTKRVGEICARAGLERFIFTGTIDSYDAATLRGAITEDTGLDPKIHRRNDYARSKAMCEAELLKIKKQEGLPLVIARPGIVIGDGSNPVHWGVGMWPAPNVCRLWGSGNVKLPLVLATDCALGLLKCMTTPNIIGESFNLVGDPILSAREYLAACEEASGIHFEVVPTSIWRYYLVDLAKFVAKKTLGLAHAKPYYKNWMSRSQRRGYNNSKAKAILNWHPESNRGALVEQGIVIPVRKSLL